LKSKAFSFGKLNYYQINALNSAINKALKLNLHFGFQEEGAWIKRGWLKSLKKLPLK
jgi:hypothetical protein